jgi:hypothetical protein
LITCIEANDKMCSTMLLIDPGIDLVVQSPYKGEPHAARSMCLCLRTCTCMCCQLHKTLNNRQRDTRQTRISETLSNEGHRHTEEQRLNVTARDLLVDVTSATRGRALAQLQPSSAQRGRHGAAKTADLPSRAAGTSGEISTRCRCRPGNRHASSRNTGHWSISFCTPAHAVTSHTRISKDIQPSAHSTLQQKQFVELGVRG